MKKSRYILILLFALGGLSVSAQNFDEYRKKVLQEMADFKSSVERDYDAYRDAVNAEYAEFMRYAWTRFYGEPPVPVPQDVPDIPPPVLPVLEPVEIPDEEHTYVDVIFLESDDLPDVPLMLCPDVSVQNSSEEFYSDSSDPCHFTHEVNLYGTICRFSFNPDSRIWLRDISESSAADMWTAMNSSAYERLLVDCLKTRRDMNLCDWAYYKLSVAVAESIYGETNEAVMLAAFIMCQSRYSIRIGLSDDGCLHLLLGTKDGMYGYPSYRMACQDFYLVDGSQWNSLLIFDKEFPDVGLLDLSIDKVQRFAEVPSSPRVFVADGESGVSVELSVNENLMDFYSSYPSPYRKDGPPASWTFYADAPLSETVRETLFVPLYDAIKGKTEFESANIIINFVQTAFEYRTDEEQWGYERVFFPEETLYYDYSDCEDRAILYARLVRELLGLDVVFLSYPGHLATAVRFEDDVRGDHLMIDGSKYIVCDPTYINAPVGLQMPGLDENNIQIIRIPFQNSVSIK